MQSQGRAGEAVGGLLIVLASIQFGVIVILGKIVSRGGRMDVPSMLAVRFGLGAFILLGILVAFRQPLLPVPGERTRIALLSIFGYAAESGLFFMAIQHGEAAIVTLLFFMYPIFVTLGSLALGEGAPGLLVGLSLVLALSGAALVILSSGGLAVAAIGVVFVVGAGIVYSGYLLAAARVIRKTNALTAAMWVSAGASLGLALFALLSGRAELPREGAQWARLVAMGVASAGAFVCLLEGLKRIGALRAAIVGATEPLAAAVLAVLFLSETITVGIVAGGVLILSGAVVASLARRGPETVPDLP
jgi:drug/metabolite transporter (DMT)-like permease